MQKQERNYLYKAIIYFSILGLFIFFLSPLLLELTYSSNNLFDGYSPDFIIYPLLLLFSFYELFTFYIKGMKKFLTSTNFSENIKRKKKISIYYYSIVSSIAIVIAAVIILFEKQSTYANTVFSIIPLTVIIFIFLILISKKWNLPIEKFYEDEKHGFYVYFLWYNLILLLIYVSYRIFLFYSDEFQFGLSFLLFLSNAMIFFAYFIFLNRVAEKYEFLLFKVHGFASPEDKPICAHCQVPLPNYLIKQLYSHELIYCSHCGGKILKQEIVSPDVQEVKNSHKELMSKIRKIKPTANISPSKQEADINSPQINPNDK